MDQGQALVSCSHCGSSDLRSETVRSAFWHEDRLVVVAGIRALVCGACHEQFFDDDTAVRLDLLRGAGFPPEQAQSELRVPVFALYGRPATEAEP
ncbi:MAG TPA: YgiT-type zinc finger protein [Acetobacteraceae bacterium]|nr:YgiT-type zinc finger protein [Acetobacteraceae bacterium]